MALVRFQRRLPRGAFPGFPTIPAFEEMENRLQKFFDDGTIQPFDNDFFPQPLGLLPAMEIAETPHQLVLTAELPGLDRKDVDISVDDGVLTIRGEKTAERKDDEKDKKYFVFERAYGSFNRSFTLPRTVDAAKIAATFDKGVLKIVMPKTVEAKAKARTIEIAEVK